MRLNQFFTRHSLRACFCVFCVHVCLMLDDDENDGELPFSWKLVFTCVKKKSSSLLSIRVVFSPSSSSRISQKSTTPQASSSVVHLQSFRLWNKSFQIGHITCHRTLLNTSLDCKQYYMIKASIKYKNQDNSYILIQLIKLYTYKHLIAIRNINTVECTDAFS